MPKSAKKTYRKRPSPFEDFLEKLIVYELTKPEKQESDEGSISSGSSSCDTESEAGRTTPKVEGRPSVIVENVNYVVDIV